MESMGSIILHNPHEFGGKLKALQRFGRSLLPAFQEDRQHFDTPLWGSIDLPEGLCRQLEFE